ncbi:hypothetical protein INT45_001982 [Circinella minor]|uniref:CxC1-like cysteine cluster associated with KDZ transposases domain-containing protein n=1 Tax=Circinella minor TaxID=1195481 RepID=A0A8H7VJ92_9FUNG|nr:hypothetical protein INT45_001982 [Circinella minor]
MTAPKKLSASLKRKIRGNRSSIITGKRKLIPLEGPKRKRSSMSLLQRSLMGMDDKDNLASRSTSGTSDKTTASSIPQNEVPSCYFDNGDDFGGDQDAYKEVNETSIHNPTSGRSSRVVDLSTPTENKSNAWLKLFPELWKAYLRGLGLYQIDNTKVELVGSRQCGCDTIKINIKRNIRVSSCDKCPEFSVPLALMELHMFPLSAVKPEVAIHIDVMDTYLGQQFIQPQSVTSIVKLVEYQFPRTVPNSLKKILTKILPIYAKMKMVIDHHLQNAHNLIKSDICPACMYEPTSPLQFALDGNFSLRRLANVPDDSYNSILSHNYHSTNNYWVADDFPVQPVRRSTNSTFPDLEDVPLAIPVFHAYSHGPSCQIDYHPHLLPFGLTDAEWRERLWAYIGGFSTQTKYSGPNKHKLTLSCALDSFKKEKVKNIGHDALLPYDMDTLGELWESFKNAKQGQLAPESGTYDEAKERLRNAVAKYDWTIEIL